MNDERTLSSRCVASFDDAVTCTSNVTVSSMESAEITCSVEYEYLNSMSSAPLINLVFYIQDQNSTLTSVDQSDVNSIADTSVNHSSTLWKRSINSSIRAMDPGEKPREYLCIVIPDTWQPEQVLQSNEHICRTMVHVRRTCSFSFTEYLIHGEVLYFSREFFHEDHLSAE